MMNKILFFLILVFCLSPWSSSATALFLGLALSLSLGNPFIAFTKKHTSTLLQFCVIGLGAGMNLKVVAMVGLQGIGYTVAGILFTCFLGWLMAQSLRTSGKLSTLITLGTAICGGSAIAAISPVIKASDRDISLSLATVFILNAIALFIFPPIGHFLLLDQNQFGLWSALAIHDTSSVVGASLQYGSTALQIATTVKLARALWIIPVSFLAAFIMNRMEKGEHIARKAKRPWFILGFIVMAALVTWVPALVPLGQSLSFLAKKFLVVTLFLIGSGLSLKSLKEVGMKPLLLGFGLWVIVASTTLFFIKLHIIH